MHIVIFVDFHDSSVGGVQTSVRGQRRGLEKLGHTVTIVSPPPVGVQNTDPSIICVPCVPVVRPNGFPMAFPSQRAIRFIESELAKREPIDIIHIQTNIGIGMMGAKIARSRGIPTVQTMHGRDDVFARSFPLPYLTMLAAKTIHRRFVPYTSIVNRLDDMPMAHSAWQIMVQQAQAADRVIMPSHHFADKFRAHGVTQPITVISNGISDEVVETLSAKVRPAPKNSKLKVMWCGRLSGEKRPIESIDAVMGVPGCTIDLYGDGPLAGAIGDYVKARGYEKRVNLKGRVNQAGVLKAMQKHDVLLYPSYGFDNQPMVLIEAVAAGIPVIYCDPDLGECMAEKGARITKSTSVDSITETLDDIAHSPREWLTMHRAMLKHRPKIAQGYHTKKMVQLYMSLLKKRH